MNLLLFGWCTIHVSFESGKNRILDFQFFKTNAKYINYIKIYILKRFAKKKINLKMSFKYESSKVIAGVVAWNAMGACGVTLSSEDGRKGLVEATSGLEDTGQASVAEVRFYI